MDTICAFSVEALKSEVEVFELSSSILGTIFQQTTWGKNTADQFRQRIHCMLQLRTVQVRHHKKRHPTKFPQPTDVMCDWRPMP